MPLIPMQEMPFWELVKNSPEWVSVFASALFAGVTIVVIIWQVRVMKSQVRVMKWQAKISARHERRQNDLIRLQHEHDWLNALNVKREVILKTASNLHIKALYIESDHAINDDGVWSELLKLRADLRLQMEILDVAAYTKDQEGWYGKLMAWSNEVFRIITEDFETTKTPGIPTTATRQALKAAETTFAPIQAIYALQLIIRADTETFKKKWDSGTASL
jgi:hypothetical protein